MYKHGGEIEGQERRAQREEVYRIGERKGGRLQTIWDNITSCFKFSILPQPLPILILKFKFK